MDKDLYDLTAPQKSIWLTEKYNKDTSIGNIVGVLHIDEEVDIDNLNESINIFIKNNDGLRLHLFLDNENIKQYIHPYSPFNFGIKNIKDEKHLKFIEENITNTHFNLLDSDLFEFTVFQFPNGHGGFIVKLHHIISDAWTMSILTNQIITNYNNLLKGTTVNNISYSYIDFINSEKQYLTSTKFQKSKEFWNNEFDSISFSYISKNNSNSYEANRKSYLLDKTLCNNITSFCESNKTSPYNIFMSALSIYLSKINNVSNPIIGTPVLNRSNFKEKNTIGMFISTVPFKTHVESNDSYINFLNGLLDIQFSVFRNQKYPYNILLDDIRKKFNFSKNLYDVALSYQNARDNKNSIDIKYHTEWLFNGTVSNNLDIHIYDMDNTGILSISYDYKKELFKEIDIILLHKRLISIITQIIDNPNILIKNIDILCNEERDFITHKYNKIVDLENLKPVILSFEDQVEKVPNNVAICYNNISYTYKELNNLVNNLAYNLDKKNVHVNDILCLFFENSIELIVSILATLKLGACYIPIDTNYPIERINYIIKNSCSKLILCNNISSKKILDINNKLLVELNNLSTKFNINIDSSKLAPNLLAYIIYTSGSTGKPKGVKISNKSLSNYIDFSKKQYVGNEITNFPLYSSIAFDLTVTSVFTPLTTGNSLYIYKNDNPQLLLKSIINDKKVQIIKLTPAHLNLLSDIDCSESIINKFIVGGDILSVETCEKISSKFLNDIHIYNEYGPTEATVGCMIYEYSKKENNSYSSLPIGRPIDNVNIYVLDNQLNLVPCGQLGEMYIGGNCLSKGYIGMDDANKKAFIQSPFNPNELLYKTGDLSKLYYNDTMEYFGRSDFQVKINGFRIEIGEIQSNLLKYSDIKDCYVTMIEIKGQKILCAYYTSYSNLDINNLDSYLRKALPLYMIPKYFIKLEFLPLTVNGKIDKKLLPIPKITEEEYVSPVNSLEILLQNIFFTLLNLDKKISVTSNIFNYYVDSLLLIKAQTMLYTNGIDVNTQIFYEYKTIRELANYILNHTKSDYYNESSYPDINKISAPIENNFSYNNILLLGSTGFLGIHILYSILHNTNSELYCIIREKNNISSYDRLKNKFTFYFSEETFYKFEPRIHIIEGNILQNNFNLSSETYKLLCETINCVIDTAAIVKHYGSYDEFFETNVNGTKQIINFCKEINIPLHYVSTLSISGYGLVSIPHTANFSETDLFIGQHYKDNVYVRSKFEAEKLIINECKNNNLIASIYRVGNITNRFSDGFFQENAKENAFLNRLIAFISLRMYTNRTSKFKL